MKRLKSQPCWIATPHCKMWNMLGCGVRCSSESVLAQRHTLLASPRESSEVERSSLTLPDRLLMLSSQLLRLLPEPEPLLCSDPLPLLLLSEPRLHLKTAQRFSN